MSVERVLAAAAALRDFTVDELAAFCDEQPSAIVGILDAARHQVEQLDQFADPLVTRWHVVDLHGLRRDLAVRAGMRPGHRPVRPPHRGIGTSSTARLLLAEQTLAEGAATRSAAERHILVATAKNHLRQVVAGTLPAAPTWWSVEFSLRQLGDALTRHPDDSVLTRLRLDLALAWLAEREVTGHAVPVRDLVRIVRRFQRLIPVLENPPLRGLVGCFVDLTLAQLVPRDPSSIPASDRLIIAVARRRIRAQVDHDLGAAMHSLVPLLKSLGRQHGRFLEQGLYRVLGHLPDGRARVVVYTDLLQMLPRQHSWQATTEHLPGALVEAVTDPEASAHLARWADTLTQDLTRSPFGSDAALLGQAADVFQDLTELTAGLDDTVRARSEQTCSELLELANTRVWVPCVDTSPAPARWWRPGGRW